MVQASNDFEDSRPLIKHSIWVDSMAWLPDHCYKHHSITNPLIFLLPDYWICVLPLVLFVGLGVGLIYGCVWVICRGCCGVDIYNDQGQPNPKEWNPDHATKPLCRTTQQDLFETLHTVNLSAPCNACGQDIGWHRK